MSQNERSVHVAEEEAFEASEASELAPPPTRLIRQEDLAAQMEVEKMIESFQNPNSPASPMTPVTVEPAQVDEDKEEIEDVPSPATPKEAVMSFEDLQEMAVKNGLVKSPEELVRREKPAQRNIMRDYRKLYDMIDVKIHGKCIEIKMDPGYNFSLEYDKFYDKKGENYEAKIARFAFDDLQRIDAYNYVTKHLRKPMLLLDPPILPEGEEDVHSIYRTMTRAMIAVHTLGAKHTKHGPAKPRGLRRVTYLEVADEILRSERRTGPYARVIERVEAMYGALYMLSFDKVMDIVALEECTLKLVNGLLAMKFWIGHFKFSMAERLYTL